MAYHLDDCVWLPNSVVCCIWCLWYSFISTLIFSGAD